MTHEVPGRESMHNASPPLSMTPQTHTSWLMNRTGPRRHARIELDIAKGVLVVDQVLLQDGVQRLGLLRAQVDALKVTDFHAVFVLLLQGAKHQEEVPDVHSHLHAVGIALAVVGRVRQLNRWLRRILHYDLGHRSVTEQWPAACSQLPVFGRLTSAGDEISIRLAHLRPAP